MDDGEREESGKDFEVEVADVSRSGRIRTEQGLSPRQRFWRLASAIGVVALVLLVLALDVSGRLNPQQFLPKPPPPLILRLQTQGMSCLFDAAWSPRSTRIALLGSQYDVACPDFSQGRRAGLVTVYEARSGKLVATPHPDDAPSCPRFRPSPSVWRRLPSPRLRRSPRKSCISTYSGRPMASGWRSRSPSIST